MHGVRGFGDGKMGALMHHFMGTHRWIYPDSWGRHGLITRSEPRVDSPVPISMTTLSSCIQVYIQLQIYVLVEEAHTFVIAQVLVRMIESGKGDRQGPPSHWGGERNEAKVRKAIRST
jgi:hypothetical protein